MDGFTGDWQAVRRAWRRRRERRASSGFGGRGCGGVPRCRVGVDRCGGASVSASISEGAGFLVVPNARDAELLGVCVAWEFDVPRGSLWRTKSAVRKRSAVGYF